MGSAADDIASGTMAKWAEAFSRLDADGLASLYSRQALFYGSNPTLYRGRDGVRSYFEGLPRWKAQSVRFTGVSTEAVGTEVVNTAGTANFAFDDATLAVKITWVIVREDGDWKIVSHHVSSKAPLI